METEKKGLNKKRLFVLLLVLVVVLFATVFALNMGGVRIRLQADTSAEVPELTTHIKNLEQYDTVFIGFPTWWYDLPQVMYSFFDEYDLSGKTIIPFNSANGSKFSGTIGTIQELEADAKVIENGLSVDEGDVAGAEEQVNNWLKEIGYQ